MQKNKEPIQEELNSVEALARRAGKTELPEQPFQLDLSKFKFDLRDNSHIQAFCFYVANKALEKYNTNLEEIHKTYDKGMIGEIPWFQHYTFETEEEYLTWKKFVYKCLRDQVRPKISNEMINSYVKEIGFLYGLRQAYLHQVDDVSPTTN